LHLTSQAAILEVEGLSKTFRSGAGEITLFDNLSFRVQPGEMLALVGASGAGKSTLLHILGALERPNRGTVRFSGRNVASLTDEAAAEFRNREIGYAWQFHYLLPEFTALENAAMPLLVRGMRRIQAEEQALQWLREVALEARAHHRAGKLSGGEQQRVALARALITKPKILLADEPTGDLDNRTADAVFELIAQLHGEHMLTSLIATHNLEFARRCHRVLRLHQGQIEEVMPDSLRS
jgi:lipoprotein-releasing system ATP-binding protein